MQKQLSTETPIVLYENVTERISASLFSPTLKRPGMSDFTPRWQQRAKAEAAALKHLTLSSTVKRASFYMTSKAAFILKVKILNPRLQLK